MYVWTMDKHLIIEIYSEGRDSGFTANVVGWAFLFLQEQEEVTEYDVVMLTLPFWIQNGVADLMGFVLGRLK